MSKSLQSQAPLKDLPIASVVDEVLEALHSGNVLLHAEPGAGKSTGMPLALLQGAGIAGKIIMLEPRRLAARGVAERLAAQLGESVGERIGLRMRGMTRTSSSTRLEVVTEGVLTRMLQADPSLEGIDLVILDEFHERSLHADLGLALCLEVQNALRPELRLLLMSATLAMENLHQHLHQATRIFCAARQFPVSIIWVGESQQALALRVSNVVLKAINEHQGDVLVFLPGVAEIEKTATQLAPRLGEQQVICRLHSGVSVNEQRAATAPASSAVRRIILSTSIAETSLTIDGVCIVVDAGLERRGRVDSRSGAVLLETIKSNQSSATQRSGRAGRTAPGVCYRLWSEEGHGRRAENWQAEIQRADLAPLLMELKLWGVNSVAQLPWLEPPPPAALARAEDLLERLGILELGQLTQHGRAVARLPLHPRLGHMMIWAAQKGAGELSCSLAVLLDDLDRRREQVDVEVLLKNSPGKQQQERIKRLARELSGELPPSETTSDAPSLGVILAQAYPDWIGRRRSVVTQGLHAKTHYTLSCGAGAQIAAEEALATREWLAVAKLGGQDREGRIFLASALNIEELEHFAPEMFSTKDRLDWDDKLERVVGERQKLIGDLVVAAHPLREINDADRARALLEGVRRRSLQCLPWTDDSRQWQARVQRIARLGLEHHGVGAFPAVDDDSLLLNLEDWLLPYLSGRSSMKALSQLDLYKVLSTMLDYQQQKLLDDLLPLRYTVPSGSQIRLRYLDEGNPVLSVKLQEMFGCTTNPSIAQGKIPLKVELLSPGGRPVQVTEDLANFWHNSYSAVKKEMAGRYPKHHWPDDPLAATPTTRAKPRKKK